MVYGRFPNVLFANFWSRLAYVFGQFPNWPNYPPKGRWIVLVYTGMQTVEIHI